MMTASAPPAQTRSSIGSGGAGRERAFGIDELFFSTTDRKGRILDGNEVFLRVAGYERHEVIGQPHNLIRHPDMPRAVFRLLWDHLENDQPIAAYVKNRAKDGGSYWVLATARPIANGYMSIRTKPCSQYFEPVRELYVQMRSVEEALERDGRGRTEAMDASSELLGAALERLGYPGYDEFMRDVLATELRERDRLLGRQDHDGSGASSTLNGFEQLHRAGRGLSRHLEAMFARVANFRDLYAELTQQSAGLLGLADDVALLALNGIVASKQLGIDAPALEAVASSMRDTCGLIATDVRTLSDETGPAMTSLGQTGFAVGMAKLQWEILSFVLQQLARLDGSEVSVHDLGSVRFLSDALLGDVSDVTGGLVTLNRALRNLSERARELARDLRQLTAVELNGRVQSAAAGSPPTFTTLFDQVRERGDHARQRALSIAKLLEAHDHVDTDDRRVRDAVSVFSHHRGLLVS